MSSTAPEGDKTNMNNDKKKKKKENNGDVPYVAAANMLSDGRCSVCDKDVDCGIQGIQCRHCKNWFHAIGCQDDSLCVSSSSAFTNQLLPALTKSGAFARRFGCFYFMCDFCITAEEEKQTVTTTDRVTILDRKIDGFHADFKSELQELKNVILDLKNVGYSRADSIDDRTEPAHSSPWDDKQKVDHLKQMMVIKKDNDGKPVDRNRLEKTCVENGVGILNTFQLNKSNDTALILKSKHDADILKQKLGEALPNHQLDQVATKVPRITVVGLQRQYDKSELKDMICKQNPGISLLINSPTTSEVDKKLDVVAIIPLKNNSDVFKAIVLTSNIIRSAISNQNDRIYIGSQPVCKVYDSFFVLRCYKCQEFGHFSKDCTKSETCGHCSGPHQTRDCEVKADPAAACCNNCKKVDSSDSRHPANSSECPIFKKLQDKVRLTTPFHQKKN